MLWMGYIYIYIYRYINKKSIYIIISANMHIYKKIIHYQFIIQYILHNEGG